MSYQLWSWLLTIVGVTGFILAGKKVWWCWYINIACQGLWVTYAIVTEQYGFIVASAVYTVVFSRNAVVWTQEHRERTSVEHALKIGAITPNEARSRLAGWSGNLSTYKAEVETDDVAVGVINVHTILRQNRHSSLPPFQWYGPMTEPNPPGPYCICTGCTTRAMM